MNPVYIHNDYYVYVCPYESCNQYIMIFKHELNCCIFRHAVDKSYKQIHPHASKEECEKLIRNDMIYGCCKPFRIINEKIEKCDYI